MRTLLRLLAAFALAFGAGHAAAQAYPVKPVRIVITFPPGGSSDLIGRLVAPQLADKFGQPFVIDNRGGGGGMIGAEHVARAAPDGYTLLIAAGGGLTLGYAIHGPKMPYDPLKDFAPITLLVTSPMIVSVNPSQTPVSSIKELLAVIRAKPGIPFGSGGQGTGMHLAGEYFRQLAGVDMLHVPYKGNGPALNDVMSGQVPMAFTDLGSAVRFIKSGRLRVLAVASATRSATAPEIPTAAESGLPGWESLGSFGLLAPAGTPAAVLQRLNAETGTALRKPDIREKILATGNEPAPMTLEEYGKFLRNDYARWVKVVKESGQKFE